ncbi:spindle assembly checkpoint component MAD1-like [Penaeus monodon]|uniref:spindle assembly checkpoint component MAD1-like n=1 Tax=Penaeus monodon TaxID=6687 RepID=UPI0018A72490|nr:spindle assembly checkpoint component MAD1-like [Penaeus monodon]
MHTQLDLVTPEQDQLAQEKHKAQQQKAMEMAMETEREKFEMDIRFLRDELKILKDKCKKEKQDEDKNYGSDESDTQRLAKENRDLKENISSLQEQHKADLKALKKAEAEKMKDAIASLQAKYEEMSGIFNAREAEIQKLQMENSL